MAQGHYPLNGNTHPTGNPSFPDMEEATLKYWDEHDIFAKSVNERAVGNRGDNEFVFYDGPPFANGLPHYGHLLTGYIKDIVGRYQTMLGHRVERRFGWDTHGLPAELEAQRLLGIDDVSEITKPGGLGIEKFNAECRSSVLRYTDEWQDYVTRQARWVDFDDDYKTLDITYMESVLWAFKTLYDKGLAYEGYRVLPYCWHDRTPLSNHELKMDDDVYQDRTDQSVTVGLRMESGELALIWTTTPWTLPSNLAITVGPDIEYVTVVPQEGELAGERVIIAHDLLASYSKELGEGPTIEATYPGSELVGRRYAPIFDYFDTDERRAEGQTPGPNAWTIIAGDFVTTEDGTGLVHTAPAFGEDDMIACQEVGIRPVVPVDEAGCFSFEVPDYEGVQVFDANKLVLAHLREQSGPIARRPEEVRAKMVRQSSFTHSYPHCWRCRKPLIYKAVSSWFVKVSAFRDRMVELNQQITWVPEHTKDGIFGNWLAGARDWSISRNRFWGAPIPVWVSDNPEYPRVDVYGSIADLEADFGVEVTDLHRPFIDTLTRPNPDDPTGTSTMHRISDVFDCWFESGSMPYAQVHYPFENRDWFESHYPGDFIVEYIGQTRGWFYTLHVLATALFDRPAFTHCVSHGIVLGDDGRKMSKSLRNFPDVNRVFDEYGSDAMRWFLMSSPVVRGGNLIVHEGGIRDTVRQILLPLWNAYHFLALYAGASDHGNGYVAEPLALDDPKVLDGLDVMDRYLLARTQSLADAVRTALDAYDIGTACSLVQDHMDVLTNWYVRTQRQRFWDEDARACDTLSSALVTLCEVTAPLLPLLTEEIWRALTGGESVHLQDWPTMPEAVRNDELVAVMDAVRQAVSGAHALRKTHNLRVRQPLRQLSVVSEAAPSLEPFASLIASEVNVKNVTLVDPDHSGLKVTTQLALNPREFAPEVRKVTSQLFAAHKQGQWELDESGQTVTFPNVEVGGQPVQLGEGQFSVSTTVEASEGEVASVLADGTVVVLDTDITAELAAEGYARDVIRIVQDERKREDLNISDRIDLELTVPEEHVTDVQTHRDMIAHETLSLSVSIVPGDTLAAHVSVHADN